MQDNAITNSWLGDEDLREALCNPLHDVTAVRRAAIALWRRRASRPGDDELTSDEEKDAARWLSEMRSDPAVEGFVTPGLSGGRDAIPRWGFYSGLSEKLGTIAQRHCTICPTSPPDSPWFHSVFRTRPESRQMVSGAQVDDLRRRVSDHAGDTYAALKTRSLCVSLTFVLASSRRERIDVDNMAKTMLDVLRGTVYEDDAQIQHLDLVKLRMREDEEEWIAARIRPTAIDLHADVFDPTVHHTFAVNAI